MSPGLRPVLRGALLSLFFLSCSSSSSSSSGASGGPSSSGEVGPGQTGSPADKPNAAKLFSAAVKHVTVEVDYQAGAEPYVGKAGQYSDVWKLFNTNALAVFDGKKTVAHPSKLADMEKLDDVTAEQFTTSDILAIAAAHRASADTDDTMTYYVVFLNGKLVDDSGAVQDDVLGVSIGATAVIAMFKPVIASTTAPKSPIAQLVEQTTLIHEFGHAVGFVDNGVPLAASNQHLDSDHGAHCTNDQCVMYWKVEGTKAAINFVTNYIISNDPVIYGQECLSDARVYENSLLGK